MPRKSKSPKAGRKGARTVAGNSRRTSGKVSRSKSPRKSLRRSPRRSHGRRLGSRRRNRKLEKSSDDILNKNICETVNLDQFNLQKRERKDFESKLDDRIQKNL